MLRMAESSEADEALMARFARGDVVAFETLYRRHELKVWRYLYRSVNSQAAADDLLQDVWINVSQAAQRFQPSARFTTWLFTLAHNRLVDGFRRTRPTVSLEAAAEQGASWVEGLAADPRSEPARQAESAQQLDALLTAVDALPTEQREAFLMQAEGGLSVEDIATAMAVSFETAKSRLRYARARLQQLLREQV
jgi:RNA polymerase sigma-70 factor (ECF subfamily)